MKNKGFAKLWEANKQGALWEMCKWRVVLVCGNASSSDPKGSGSILPSPILCFIKRCYDKEEFDTDRSSGFLKNFKWDIMLHKVRCLGCVPQETCSVTG